MIANEMMQTQGRYFLMQGRECKSWKVRVYMPACGRVFPSLLLLGFFFGKLPVTLSVTVQQRPPLNASGHASSQSKFKVLTETRPAVAQSSVSSPLPPPFWFLVREKKNKKTQKTQHPQTKKNSDVFVSTCQTHGGSDESYSWRLAVDSQRVSMR